MPRPYAEAGSGCRLVLDPSASGRRHLRRSARARVLRLVMIAPWGSTIPPRLERGIPGPTPGGAVLWAAEEDEADGSSAATEREIRQESERSSARSVAWNRSGSMIRQTRRSDTAVIAGSNPAGRNSRDAGVA